jgi:hypothetical protein
VLKVTVLENDGASDAGAFIMIEFRSAVKGVPNPVVFEEVARAGVTVPPEVKVHEDAVQPWLPVFVAPLNLSHAMTFAVAVSWIEVFVFVAVTDSTVTPRGSVSVSTTPVAVVPVGL